MQPTVIIPWFPGTNCHHEMARAFELAGAKAKIVPLKTLIDRPQLSEADLIGFAGGFSYGDHIRSGAIAACDLVWRLRDELETAAQKKIPILGVCNGFQILVECGILPGASGFGRPDSILDINRSTKFEHWSCVPIHLHNRDAQTRTASVWTEGLEGLALNLPVAHGEGRLVPDSRQQYHVTATYGSPEGDPTMSPNGSAIAGICSPDGLVMGLMPHPERRIDPLRGGSQGLCIFNAGVTAVR